MCSDVCGPSLTKARAKAKANHPKGFARNAILLNSRFSCGSLFKLLLTEVVKRFLFQLQAVEP